MTPKLHYFQTNGLGEAIRYILYYSGQKFEDVRYDIKTWGNNPFKNSLPYGQMPYYVDGNRTLNQSIAIARYVASKADLVPADTWDQAVLDAAVNNVYEVFHRVVVYLKETDVTKKEALRKELLTETIDYYFSRFEKQMKDNNGCFLKGKLSWADFMLVGISEHTNLFLDTEVEKKYPTVKALMQKITNHPRVKAYIATRKPYTVK